MYYSPLRPPPVTAPSPEAADIGVHSTRSGDPKIVLRSRRLVFENTVFSVFADHISDERGREVPHYLSVVPKCAVDDGVTGVAVLPIIDGKLGLIRVFRHPLNRWSWEVSKGHVDAGEDVRIAATRELREETGFSILPEHLVDLGLIAPEAGVIKGRIRLFSAKLEGGTGDTAEGELGHGKMAFYGPEEVSDLIAQGEIEDASTLSLLLKHMLKQIAAMTQ